MKPSKNCVTTLPAFAFKKWVKPKKFLKLSDFYTKIRNSNLSSKNENAKYYKVKCMFFCCYDDEQEQCITVRGDTDKSLARPTSGCRTESIVSLERGVRSCSELQVFFVTEAEKKHARRRARFQQHRDGALNKYFSWKVRRRRKFTPFW